MCRFNEKAIENIWSKGKVVEGFDSGKYRKDACGAWIQRDKYNDRESDFGWEIDHVFPQSKLKENGADQEEIDNDINLRPMNWRNNVSKEADYPVYHAAIKSDDNKNITTDDEFEVNKDLQAKLKAIYGKYYDW